MLLYPKLIKHALKEWTGDRLFLALDTSMLWNRFALVRLALVYRGRAIPLGWTVCNSKSAVVHLARYRRMLVQVAQVLPEGVPVVLLADRGFMDVKLLRVVRQLGSHFRVRVKSSVMVYRATHSKRSVKAMMPLPGGARFFSHVWLTEQSYGSLHLALAHVRTPTMGMKNGPLSVMNLLT